MDKQSSLVSHNVTIFSNNVPYDMEEPGKPYIKEVSHMLHDSIYMKCSE